MKKLISLAVALMMLLGVVATAEEAVRVDFGKTFSIARPAGLEVIELTEDDAQEGMVYAATSDELEMYVWSFPIDARSKDELYDEYRTDDFLENVEVKTIEGVEYLQYNTEEEMGAVFICSDGQYYEFVFYCVTDDAMAAAQSALDSIKPL